MVESVVEEVRKNAKNYKHFKKPYINQFIVSRVLSELGWNIYNYKEVLVGWGDKPDYKLITNRNSVVVHTEKNITSKVEESFVSKRGLTVLTNGIKWQFYLPGGKKFLTVDFTKGDVKKLASELKRYISKDSVKENKHIQSAKKTLKAVNLEKDIKEMLNEYADVVKTDERQKAMLEELVQSVFKILFDKDVTKEKIRQCIA